MENNRTYTCKAVLSNKAALAGALAAVSAYKEIFHGATPIESIGAEIFQEMAGNSMLLEFEKLGNKEYRDIAIEEIKNNKDMARVFNSLKKIPPTPFMGNISKNIEDGYIEVTSKSIAPNDYIFIISPEFLAAVYKFKDVTLPNDDLKRSAVHKLFSEFKNNPDKFPEFYKEISEKGLEKDFTHFGSDFLSETLKQGLEYGSEKFIIKSLIDNNVGQFVIFEEDHE